MITLYIIVGSKDRDSLVQIPIDSEPSEVSEYVYAIYGYIYEYVYLEWL